MGINSSSYSNSISRFIVTKAQPIFLAANSTQSLPNLSAL